LVLFDDKHGRRAARQGAVGGVEREAASVEDRTGRQMADEMRRTAPASKKGDISGYSADVTCPRCGQKFTVAIVVILGCKEKESVDCPYCGARDAYSEMCWSIFAHESKA
jgi:uncharacterized Zn-finger protein